MIGLVRARLAQDRFDEAREAVRRFGRLTERLGEEHVGRLWRQVFERQLDQRGIEGELRAAADRSGDEELIAYLESFEEAGDE
jgi:hypothetical protein